MRARSCSDCRRCWCWLSAGWWIYSAAIERRWTDFAHRLESEPGIVLTHAEKRGSKFYISGLRDPLAADPAIALARRTCHPTTSSSTGRNIIRWFPALPLSASSPN